MEIVLWMQILFGIVWVIFGAFSGIYVIAQMEDDILNPKWKWEYFNPCKYQTRGSFLMGMIVGGAFGFMLIIMFVIMFFDIYYKKWTWFHKPICGKKEN